MPTSKGGPGGASSAHRRQMSEWSLWFRLVVTVLATWRLAHLLAHEDGPFDLVVRLRRQAGDGRLGALMDCPYCLGLWIAAPLALVLSDSLMGWFVGWLAISGGAAWLESTSDRETASRSPQQPDGE